MPTRMNRSREIVMSNGFRTVTGSSDVTKVIFEP